MKKKLVTTNNALNDIIGWLTEDYIICLFTDKDYVFHFSKQTLDKIENEAIIYLNLNRDPTLLCEGEWSDYLIDAGFPIYKSINILPVNEDKIYNMKL